MIVRINGPEVAVPHPPNVPFFIFLLSGRVKNGAQRAFSGHGFVQDSSPAAMQQIATDLVFKVDCPMIPLWFEFHTWN